MNSSHLVSPILNTISISIWFRRLNIENVNEQQQKSCISPIKVPQRLHLTQNWKAQGQS